MTLASLLVPALRWDSTHGFEHQRRAIEAALSAGAGGFVLFGGSRAAVTELTAELHERSKIPLLVAVEAERGAGQQFEGCVALPPFGALGFFENPAAMRRAGQITARDLKRMGVNWALAPVCDLDIAPGSANVLTRAAGDEPELVGALVSEWIDGCQSEGVMACAKHFSGLDRARDQPFRAAIDAGVASVMAVTTSQDAEADRGIHGAVTALRDHMEFDGVIVSSGTTLDIERMIQAIEVGSDTLLMSGDITAAARALDVAAQRGVISAERIREATLRRDRWALWALPGAGREPSLDDEIWSRQVADASVHLVRGSMPRVGEAVEVVLVDDDASAPMPSRAHFAAALGELEIEANVLEAGSAGTRVPVLVAAFADVIGGKRRPGFSDEARARVARVLDVSREQKRESLIVLFSHPRHAAHFPGAANVLCAWGGEPPMQAAAARVIARASR